MSDSDRTVDSDHTVDAGPEALEQLRRLAADTDAGVADDRTVDADDSTLEHLRRLARQAEADAVTSAGAPTWAAPATHEQPTHRPAELSTLAVELDELVERRPAPPPVPAEPWRPPPRSMRPAAMPDTRTGQASPVWRWVALALAVALLTLLAWLLFGGNDGDGDEVPTEPTVSAPAANVVTTGVVGEGGSGG